MLTMLTASSYNKLFGCSAKLGVGLLSGRYAVPLAEGVQAGVSPHMYRQLVGKDHPEFTTRRQQDAHEYYLHLLTLTQVPARVPPATSY